MKFNGTVLLQKLRKIRQNHKILTDFGPSGETRTPGILLPKQARYQLRYTRIWNCFICGLSCGLGRFLTNGFAELVPASGSVPAGCGVGLFPSWMGPVFSQAGALPTALHPVIKLFYPAGRILPSRRATNCATPRYLIFVCLAVASKRSLQIGPAVFLQYNI